MKPKKTKIAVITVNFNNGSITEETIRSFAKVDKTGYRSILIVVDNGSLEDASKNLAKKLPDVHFIYSKSNLGFGRRQ